MRTTYIRPLITTFLFLITIEFMNCSTLKLVTVLFRHADRTPVLGTLYPLDPYINVTYYPYGYGQLTNTGKQHAFAFGQLLRKRYDSFLGKNYLPNCLEAISTNFDRTKATLELVLAGLFPPGGDLNWNPLLNWQPIPYSYVEWKDAMWLTFSYQHCPKYAKLLDEYMTSKAGKKFIEKNGRFIDYLNLHTGVDHSGALTIWSTYTHLLAQVEWGLELPKWAKSVFIEQFEQVMVEQMHNHVATTELRKLSGGFLLKMIISNMTARANGELSEGRKLILYSAHDANILYMSGVLDQIINKPIPYSAYYIFELIEKDGVHSVQIYTNDYYTQKITPVIVPGCKLLCPLEDFAKILNKYVPDGKQSSRTSCGHPNTATPSNALLRYNVCYVVYTLCMLFIWFCSL